jgi:transcriptional regulator with XRE-family HTH domain
MEAVDLKQEFRELLEASGWSQAEAARQLGMTPSALSQIVRQNSTVKPSPVTLRLFKLLLLREKPEALTAVPERRWTPSEKWEMDLIGALRKIPPTTRELILKSFGAIIESHLPKGKGGKTTKRDKLAKGE